MTSKLIRQAEGRVLLNNGTHYLLLDVGMKDVLSEDLGEPFDPEKHRVMVQVSRNSKGQLYAAFWFEPR